MRAVRSTALLAEEHRSIQKVLAKMVLIADRIEAGGSIEEGVLQNVRTFLGQFSEDCHHVKEEQHLFPLLEAKGVPAGGCPIAVLHNEHEKGHVLLLQLENQIPAFDSERVGEGAVAATLRDLARLYADHIWKEDFLLLPMADKILSKKDQIELGKRFRQVDAALGPGKYQQLERLAARVADAA